MVGRSLAKGLLMAANLFRLAIFCKWICALEQRSEAFSDILKLLRHSCFCIYLCLCPCPCIFHCPYTQKSAKKGLQKSSKTGFEKSGQKSSATFKSSRNMAKKSSNPKKMHKRLPNKGFQKSLRKKCNKTGLKKCDFLKSTKKSVFPSTNAKKGLLTVWSLHAKNRHISNARTGLTLI